MFGLGTKAARLKQHRSCDTHRAASVPSLRFLLRPGEGDGHAPCPKPPLLPPPAFLGFRAGIPAPHKLGSAVQEGGSQVSSDRIRSTRVCFIHYWKLPASSFKVEREIMYRTCVLTRRTSFKSRSLTYLVIKIFFITTLRNAEHKSSECFVRPKSTPSLGSVPCPLHLCQQTPACVLQHKMHPA